MNNSEFIFEKASALLREGRSITIVTVMEISGNTPSVVGEKMIVPMGGNPIGTIGGGSLERNAVTYCSTRKPEPVEICRYDLDQIGMTCGGRISLLYEYFPAKNMFVLFGGGHVATALGPILESIGYDVIIFDNREQIIQGHTEAGRKAFLCEYENISCPEEYLKSGRCFIATHNHLYDTVILKQLLQREQAEYVYIGMIGSKNKVQGAFKEIRDAGIPIPPQVYAPVGLPVGGGSPSEIAVSIAAEILAVSYGRDDIPHLRE